MFDFLFLLFSASLSFLFGCWVGSRNSKNSVPDGKSDKSDSYRVAALELISLMHEFTDRTQDALDELETSLDKVEEEFEK